MKRERGRESKRERERERQREREREREVERLILSLTVARGNTYPGFTTLVLLRPEKCTKYTFI